MKEYVIDTNVLYGIVLNDGRCNLSHVLNILNKNKGIVTYATLFEAFDKFKTEKSYISDIMKFLNDYKIEVAGLIENEENKELFWELVYKESELSEIEMDDLGKLLIAQACKYISGFLGELMHGFAILYINMKLNKENDAYNAYIACSAHDTNGFAHFSDLVAESLKGVFIASYTDKFPEKFSDYLRGEFWGVVRSIEVRHRLLTGRSVEYFNENVFEDDLKKSYEEFDKQYNENDFLGFIKQAYNEMVSGDKMLTSDQELLSMSDDQLLKPLEKDFLFYCLKRMILKQGKFRFNDIVDFINLSTAFHLADGIMTLDKPFLKIISEYSCIKDSTFYTMSMEIHKYILDNN